MVSLHLGTDLHLFHISKCDLIFCRHRNSKPTMSAVILRAMQFHLIGLEVGAKLNVVKTMQIVPVKGRGGAAGPAGCNAGNVSFQ